MPFNLKPKADEPILTIIAYDPFKSEELAEIFEQANQYIRTSEIISCILLDFRSLSQIDPAFIPVLRDYRQTIPARFPSTLVFCALMVKEDLFESMSDNFNQQQVNIPIFASSQAAQSFLNLKISGAYVQQSTSAHITSEVDNTIHIFPDIYSPHIHTSQSGTDNFPLGGMLRLENLENGKEMLVLPKGKLVIGRQDQTHLKPDIDLTMWGAFYRGVSRRHAILELIEPEHIAIIDNGSTNGILLNGVKLKPHQAYRLQDNDILMIGNLMIKASFHSITS